MVADQWANQGLNVPEHGDPPSLDIPSVVQGRWSRDFPARRTNTFLKLIPSFIPSLKNR